MYIFDKLSSGFQGDDEARQRVVRPAQRARFYPIPHSNLSRLGAPGGTITFSMRPKPLLNLDRFAYKGVAVPASHKTTLENLAKSVVDSQQAPQRIIKIRLVGHTDEDGSNSDNVKLGADRAGSVKVVLEREIEKLRSGLVTGPSNQVDIVTESRGESEPLTMDRTKNLLNRRVEVFITLSPAPTPVTPSGSGGPNPPKIDLWPKSKDVWDFEEASRKRYEEANRITKPVPKLPPQKSVAELAHEKATDFLRGKGLSKKNAERIVDLGERGAGKALDATLDQLNVGSKEKRIIVETLKVILQRKF